MIWMPLGNRWSWGMSLCFHQWFQSFTGHASVVVASFQRWAHSGLKFSGRNTYGVSYFTLWAYISCIVHTSCYVYTLSLWLYTYMSFYVILIIAAPLSRFILLPLLFLRCFFIGNQQLLVSRICVLDGCYVKCRSGVVPTLTCATCDLFNFVRWCQS